MSKKRNHLQVKNVLQQQIQEYLDGKGGYKAIAQKIRHRGYDDEKNGMPS